MGDITAARICRALLIELVKLREKPATRRADPKLQFNVDLKVPFGTEITMELIHDMANRLHEKSECYELSPYLFECPSHIPYAFEQFRGISMRVLISVDVLHDLKMMRADVHG